MLANLVFAKGHKPRFGNLVPEFERVVDAARPAWFVMENVPRAPDPAPPGYGVAATVLDNFWFGEEQRRRRKFWFGMMAGHAGKTADLRAHLDGFAALDLPSVTGAALRTAGNNDSAVKGSCLKPAVTGAHSGSHRPKGGHLITYSVAEMCRLQGLPEGHLDHAPFTVHGKRSAIANGVPLPMGRAVARAVKRALQQERAAA